MAKKTSYVLIDDIDGAELQPDTASQVTFGLDGVAYEIDLGHKNAEQLRAALVPYITAGRRVGARAPKRPARKATRTDEIRAWARANGHTISDKGRIPYAIVSAYDAS